jgi:hypothetical protein
MVNNNAVNAWDLLGLLDFVGKPGPTFIGIGGLSPLQADFVEITVSTANRLCCESEWTSSSQTYVHMGPVPVTPMEDGDSFSANGTYLPLLNMDPSVSPQEGFIPNGSEGWAVISIKLYSASSGDAKFQPEDYGTPNWSVGYVNGDYNVNGKRTGRTAGIWGFQAGSVSGSFSFPQEEILISVTWDYCDNKNDFDIDSETFLENEPWSSFEEQGTVSRPGRRR